MVQSEELTNFQDFTIWKISKFKKFYSFKTEQIF